MNNSTKQSIKFQIKKTEILETYENEILAKARVYIMREGNNAHEVPITKEAAQMSKATLANKPLLCNYIERANDFGGHDEEQVPVGVFTDQIEEVVEDGQTWIVAEAYIWKRYFPEVMEVFYKKDAVTPVSMEIDVLETEDIDGVMHIKLFAYTGVTLLGLATPAIENARAIMERFSTVEQKEQVKEELNVTEDVYQHIAFALNGDKKSPLNKKNFNKGGDYAMEKNKYMDEYMNGYISEYMNPDSANDMEYMKTFMVDYMKKYQDEKEDAQTYAILDEALLKWMDAFMVEFMKDTNQTVEYMADYMKSYAQKDVDEKDNVYMSDYACKYIGDNFSGGKTDEPAEDMYSKEEVEKMVAQEIAKEKENYQTLEKTYQALEEKFATLQTEKEAAVKLIEDLQAFQAEKIQEEFSTAVEQIIHTEVFGLLTDEDIEKLREKSKEFTLENIKDFETYVKATGFDVKKRMDEQNKGQEGKQQKYGFHKGKQKNKEVLSIWDQWK